VEELEELLEAEEDSSEGLIAVNLKMVHQGILRFLNLRYDLSMLVNCYLQNPLDISANTSFLEKINKNIL